MSLYLKFWRFRVLSLLINIELTLAWAFEKFPGKSMKTTKKKKTKQLCMSWTCIFGGWYIDRLKPGLWAWLCRISRGRAYSYSSLWWDFSTYSGIANVLWVLQHVDIVYFHLPTSSTKPVISTFLCMWTRHISQGSHSSLSQSSRCSSNSLVLTSASLPLAQYFFLHICSSFPRVSTH